MVNGSQTIHRLAMVGCGNMGQALAEGWLRRVPLEQMWVVKPTAKGLPQDTRVRHVTDVAKVPEGCQPEVVVWAVKPYLFAELMPQCPAHWRGALHVSVAAGVTVAQMHAWLGKEVAVVRSMPNTPSRIGQGMTALFAGEHVTVEQREQVERLMQAVGQVLWLQQEAQMHAFIALAGSAPAFWFYLLQVATELGVEAGIPADMAMQAALQGMQGSVALVEASRQEVGQDVAQMSGLQMMVRLREQVTSPNGTTAAGLRVWMGDENGSSGLKPLLREVFAATMARSRELAGESL